MLTELYMRLRRKTCYLLGDTRGVRLWSNRIGSRRARAALGELFDEQVPPAINIEINTDCNYKCPFCPQSSSTRPVEHMTRESFLHVVKALEELEFSGLVVLSVNNEPLLHGLWIEFCEILSRRLPSARSHVITNGSLLTADHLRTLAVLAHPPLLRINDYVARHGVAARVERMVSEVPGADRLDIDIYRRARDEVMSNRAGNQPSPESHLPDCMDLVCTWPFMGLFVRPDLKAFLCCSDYHCEVIMGDLAVQGIMEVWLSESYRETRRALLETGRRDLVLCRRCDADWFCLPEHCAGARGRVTGS